MELHGTYYVQMPWKVEVREVSHSHRNDFQRQTPICTKIGPGMQFDLYSPKIESILTLRDFFQVKFKTKWRWTL